MATWPFYLSVKRSLLMILIFLKYFWYQSWISARSRKYTDLLSTNPISCMQKNKSEIKVPSSLKIDFARTCLCLILKLNLLFLQTGTCAYMNHRTDEMEILPGMHGNSLFLYQLSLNAWKLHDSKFYSGPCSEMPIQQAKLQLLFF